MLNCSKPSIRHTHICCHKDQKAAPDGAAFFDVLVYCCLLVELPFQCFDVLAFQRQGKFVGRVDVLRLEEEHHLVGKGVGVGLEGHLIGCQPDSGTKFIFVKVDDRVAFVVEKALSTV